MTRPLSKLLIALGILSAGCQPAVAPPTVDSISPNWGFNGETTNIVVVGENFFPGIDADGGEIVAYDRDFSVRLVGPESRLMEAVRQESTVALAAAVPSGMAAGWYGIEVDTPSGHVATLEDAFEVTSTKAASLRVTADRTNVLVNEMAIVEFSLRSPDGELVAESVPIRVVVDSSNQDPHAFGFELSGLVDATEILPGQSVEGLLGPNGEGFIGVQSGTPDNAWVTVQATIRDRVLISATQLLTFTAGETQHLVVEVSEVEGAIVAGEPVEVSMRLVDELGNTVSGKTATVALQETCIGGQYQQTHTFVDDTTILAFPTMSCAANSIRGFGVVEAVPVTGESAQFEVMAGPTAGVSANAWPDQIVAGIEQTQINVVAVDGFGNRSVDGIGDIALRLASEEISLASGSGDYTCSSLTENEATCEARIYPAADRHFIDVVTSLGFEAVTNPIEVIPGEGLNVVLVMSSGTPVAGDPYAVWLAIEDAFGNRILLPDEVIAGLIFEDDHGPIECLHTGTGLADRTYSFQCTFTVASPFNHIFASSAFSGAVGSFGTFTVEPGALSMVEATLDTTASPFTAGDTPALALEGFDRLGNRVKGTHDLWIHNVAGGLISEEVILRDGVASTVIGLFRAMKGDSVWILGGEHILGGTNAFDVEAGPAVGLSVEPERMWAFAGETTWFEVEAVDAHGNRADVSGGDLVIESRGGLGPDTVAPWVPGELGQFEFDAAGIGDSLKFVIGDLVATIEPFDVALNCGDISGSFTLEGSTDGRICDGGDGAVEVATDMSDVLHFVVQKDAEAPTRSGETTILFRTGESNSGTLKGFAIDADACGKEWQRPFWVGLGGSATGPLAIVAADSSITGGTATSLSRSVLTVEAETCTGDPAAGSEIFIRASGGTLAEAEDTLFERTGSGTQMTLGPDGAGIVEVDVSDFLFGGDITIYANTFSASGALTIPTLGDSVPPRIRSVSPAGRVTLAVDRFDIEFNEPMLTSLIAIDTDALVQVTAAGESIDLNSIDFVDPRTLHVVLEEAILFFDGRISIFDEFRDESGNRLDGDGDGTSGGTWSMAFGDVTDSAPSVTNCSTSLPLFRPDGDPGEGVEAESIRVDVQTSGESHWLDVSVWDMDGKWHGAKEVDIGMSRSGSFPWDGRGDDGQVVDNGVYQIAVSAMDEHYNPGTSCVVGVRVENRRVGADSAL